MLNFTGRDFNSIRSNLISLVPTLTDKWNDMSEHDLGMVWIELLSGVSAMLNFYIDKQHNESFLDTAVEVNNIESILGNLGYQKPLRTPSMAKCFIKVPCNESVDSRLPSSIVIDKYSTLKGVDSKTYLLMEDVVVPNTSTYAEFDVYDAQYNFLDVPATKIKSFKLYLPKKPIADVGFKISVAGVEFTRVDNVFLDIQGGKKYSVHRDGNDNHYVLFSHDYTTYIGNNSTLNIVYLTTEGTNNTYIGDILGFTNPIIVETVDVTNECEVSNKESFSGGFVNPDLNLAKASTLSRLAKGTLLNTLEDFYDFFKALPTVKDVQCIDMSVQGASVKPYEVIAYLKLFEGEVGDAYNAYLQTLLKKYSHLSLSTIVMNPTYIDVDMMLNVYCKLGTNKPVLRSELVSYLTTKFSSLSFGDSLIQESIKFDILANFPSVVKIDFVDWEDKLTSIGSIFNIVSLDAQVFDI